MLCGNFYLRADKWQGGGEAGKGRGGGGKRKGKNIYEEFL